MKNFKLILFILFNLIFLTGSLNAVIYNQDGDFSLNINSLTKQIYNDNIQTSFSILVKNKKTFSQNFKIIISNQSGWNISSNLNNFILFSNSTKEIKINFTSNNNFDYSKNVVGPNIIQISQKEDYTGNFNFPIKIIGSNQNIDLNFKIKINKKSDIPISFITKVSTEPISPILPLKYSIKANNILKNTKIFVRVELSNVIIKEFSDIFSTKNNFKFYEQIMPSTFKPGIYNLKITIRIPQKDGKSIIEWNEDSLLNIVKYDKIESKEIKSTSFFKDSVNLELKNVGNVDSYYLKEFKIGAFKSLLTSSNLNFDRTQNGILFNESLKNGESKILTYTINYISLYIIFFVLIIILSYIFIRKNSNPLDIENSIYDIKKIIHEGVKEMKFKIGFENIKENEIEELKVIFRMPSYLNIKENSFSLTEPNHVLKGIKQYKLVWNFKRFEKEDSRILGFSLVNPRGILGDIKLPDLEFEVKINGKIRTYYKSFPVIRG